MTNFEYYKNTMTERELADIFCWNINLRLEGRLHDAWVKWMSIDEWLKTGRTMNVSIQQFLSMPYKKEYWN